MFIHILNALIILQVPYFYVALTYCYQNVFIGNGID